MNFCLFTGRLTKDPELKETTSGKTVVDFSIAINEGKDANGQDRVTFANCQAWDQAAKHIAKHFKKGKPITVQGRLKNEKWEKDGETKRADRIVVDRSFFVPSDGDKQEESSGESAAPASKASGKTATKKKVAPQPKAEPQTDEGFGSDEDDDEDIPF